MPYKGLLARCDFRFLASLLKVVLRKCRAVRGRQNSDSRMSFRHIYSWNPVDRPVLSLRLALAPRPRTIGCGDGETC